MTMIGADFRNSLHVLTLFVILKILKMGAKEVFSYLKASSCTILNLVLFRAF